MPELEKMTKAELLALAKSQSHLAKAIESKDDEISRLTKENTANAATIREQAHLAKAIEIKDKEIDQLKKDKLVLVGDHATAIAKVKKDQEDRIELLEARLAKADAEVAKMPDVEKIKQWATNVATDNKRLSATCMSIAGAFHSTLKGMQGIVENAVELDALLRPSLPKKE